MRACSSELEMTPILAVDQSEPVSGQSWRSHVTVEFNTGCRQKRGRFPNVNDMWRTSLLIPKACRWVAFAQGLSARLSLRFYLGVDRPPNCTFLAKVTRAPS